MRILFFESGIQMAKGILRRSRIPKLATHETRPRALSYPY